MGRVYKILTAQDWSVAQAVGRFDGSAKDLADGFIHLSTAAQAGETARLHFAGQAGLVLLALDADALGAALRWEPSRGGQMFPHLYGPLDPALVVAVVPLPLDAEGMPQVGALQP